MGVGQISKSAIAVLGDGLNPDVVRLSHLDGHSGLYLTQRVKTHDDGKQHGEEMGEAVKALHIPLATVLVNNQIISLLLFDVLIYASPA